MARSLLTAPDGFPTAPVPATATSRGWLRGPIVLGVVVALLLGLGAGVAYAFFSSHGTGTGSGSVGTLQMTNTNNGTYVVNFTGAYPNFSSSGTLTLTNSGTVPAGAMTLTIGAATNNTCAQNALGCAAGVGTSTHLSGEATISVYDNKTHTTVIAATTIDSAHSHAPYALTGTGVGGSWPVGEAHSFTVTIAVPLGADNTFQGTSTSFALNFNGTVG